MRFSSDSNRKKGEDLVKLKIKDIAKKAGVSTTAVSFALNGKEGISEQTREKILRIVEEAGYTSKVLEKREKRFDKEVKKKLREEVTVPKCVDEGIQRAYDMIGISGEKKVIRRRKRIWPAAAAVAALTAGISITAVAVNYYLKVHLKEEGQVLKYYIEVDKEQKEAHQIEVNPTYLPKGLKQNRQKRGRQRKSTGQWREIVFPLSLIMRQNFIECRSSRRMFLSNIGKTAIPQSRENRS